MTFEEWQPCVLLLRATYGKRFDLDPQAIVVWCELLGDLPGPVVQHAVKRMCQECEHFSIAEIRRFAKAPDTTSADAWGEVIAAQKAGGLYPTYRPAGLPRSGHLEHPKFTSPVVEKALEAVGGLRAICLSEPAQLNTIRAQFLKIYDALAASHGAREHAPPALPARESSPTIIGPVELRELSSGIGRPIPKGGEQ